MKRLLSGSVLAFVALGAAAGYAQSNSKFCNNALIAGVYGFVVQGTRLPTPPPPGGVAPPSGPLIGVALTEFDGKGGLTQIDTVTINGIKTADFTEAPATGTYNVNPDCTGTFTIHFMDQRPPTTVNFIVVSNGNEIDTVVISGPNVTAVGSIGKRRFVGLW